MTAPAATFVEPATTPVAPTIAERVAAGVAWLDKHVPDWADRIDLDQLRMSRACNCVLGQLFGDYYSAPMNLDGSIARGFDSVECFNSAESAERGADEFTLLQAEWTRVIEERRETAGAVV